MRPPTASAGPRWRVLLGHRRAGAAVGAAVLVVVAAVVAVLAVGGYRRSEVLLSSGTAWLPSPQGVVTLIDGPSDQVVGNVRAGSGAGQAPSVVQLGTSALVVDQQAGTVSRVDGATYAVTGPKAFGGGGPLQVLPQGKTGAVVVDGTHQQALLVDTATLATRRTLRLGVAPGPDQAVVDGSGTLWAVDAGGAGLVHVSPSGTVSDTRQVGDGSSLLATAGGKPVLVDAGGGRIGLVDASGSVPSWACTGLKLGDDPQLLSSDDAGLVYLALKQRGELLAADLSGKRCTTVPLAPAGTAFGRPVEDDGFVLVPDEAQGQAIVVDAGHVVSREQVVPAGTTFELVAKDGLVFYNDVAGPLAGVVHLQGGEWVAGAPVAKFGSSAVPSLAAANSLVPSNAVQGLPPPPNAGTVTSRAAATTTPAPGSTGPTTHSAPPTTTWPTTTSTTSLTCSFTATPSAGAPPLTVTFTDTTKGATAWSWVFGDGTSSAGRTATHTYAQAGSYPATLTAKDSSGSTCTASHPISVTEKPQCSFTFTPPSGAAPLAVTFTATTTGVTSWSWLFGDGASSAGQTVTHTYGNPGTYTATLTGKDSSGSTCTASKSITVALLIHLPPGPTPGGTAPAS